MPRYPRLDTYLEREGLDGYLVDASAEDSDQRYLSGYDAPDPYQTLYRPEGTSLLVKGLEYGRARKRSAADDVRRPTDYGAPAYADRDDHLDALEAFLEEFGAGGVAVPPRFPVTTADGLRERDVTVTPDDEGIVTEVRAVKTEEEIEEIRAAQRANETAVAAAEAIIAEAEIDGDRLVHDGDALTSERVKRVIEGTLLTEGYALDETIVAGGPQGADPHDRGGGPLPAHEPIVIDVFPRSKTTHYHADMTRTVVRGEPTPAVRDRFAVTDEARQAALDTVEPGVTGEAVHDVVCDVFEEAGYPTLREDPSVEAGFIHGTGHGVGLDVHESPRVGPGGTALESGHVITIEPGLYHPEHGGMRLEDLVVVTETGHENLTVYPLELVLGD